MEGLMKKAKLKAIMDIIGEMDDMKLEKLMPKPIELEEGEEMEMKPEKKGITIVKLESDKEPMEGEEEGEEEEESIDPYSNLARLKKRLKGN